MFKRTGIIAVWGGFYLLLCVFANEEEHTYQQLRFNLQQVHSKAKYLKSNNLPNYDTGEVDKLGKLVNMENILRNLDADDILDDDSESFDAPFDSLPLSSMQVNNSEQPTTHAISTTTMDTSSMDNSKSTPTIGNVSKTQTTDGTHETTKNPSATVDMTTDKTTKHESPTIPMTTKNGVSMTTDSGVPMTSDNGRPMTTDNGVPMTTDNGVAMTSDNGLPMTTDNGLSMTRNGVRVTTDNGLTTAAMTTIDKDITTANITPSFFVSPLCLNHTKAIIAGLFARETWALKMIDAAGKPPSGLMSGNIVWQGEYSECIGVNAVSNIAKPAYEFQGKYCNALIPLGNPPQINPITFQPIGITIGMCLPDTCSNADGKNLLNSVIMRASNNTRYVMSVQCKETLQSYDTRAIAALSVVFLFIAFMVIATVYDIFIVQRLMSRSTNEADIYQNGGTKWRTVVGKSFVNEGFTENDTTQQNGHTNPDFKYKVSGETEMSTVEEQTIANEPYKPGFFGRLLLSFSVYTNGAKILSATQGAGTLTSVNGIRFISMTWVILGHTYAFGLPSVGNFATVYPQLLQRRSFMAIVNAEVAVDTFFALSGCLVTYLTLKQMKKQKGKLNWLMFYFHRFWRLTPPYMLVLFVYVSLFPYIGSGPSWPKNGMEKNYCKDSWWYNLLYINNFIRVFDQCIAWSWYLANDMQFYVISPLIILPLYFSKIAGTIVVAVFLVGTTIASGVISAHYELGISVFGSSFLDYFEQYYEKPYCRMGPYLVGMYTGYILYKTKCTCKINKYLNLILWGVFIAAALAVLYGVYDDYSGNNKFSVGVAAFYNSLHKTVWGAAICWVIFACATGNGGFINTILSWKGLIPLSRLTYCAYLVHPPVMYYYYYTRQKQLFWDDQEVIYEFLGHLGLSYAVAFVTSLAFESPMMGLEKVIFKRGEKKQ